MKSASSFFLLCFVLCLFAQCASLRLEASSLFISGKLGILDLRGHGTYSNLVEFLLCIGAKPKVGSDRVFSLVAYDDGNGEDQSNSAKVQFMITNKMKATLKDELGYLPEEVRTAPFCLFSHFICLTLAQFYWSFCRLKIWNRRLLRW